MISFFINKIISAFSPSLDPTQFAFPFSMIGKSPLFCYNLIVNFGWSNLKRHLNHRTPIIFEHSTYNMMRNKIIFFRSFLLNFRRDMSSIQSRPFTVIVEGNIGSGKTTFMNHFKQFKDVASFSEPVDKWRDVESHNLLGIMYKDPKKWAMTFQSYVQLTMVDLHKQHCLAPIKLMERSLYSARFCFVENLYENGYLDGPEYVVLDEWFKWICSNLDVGVDMIVYLRTQPEVAFERMRLRGRKEENTVSLNYLRQLHDLHEKWLCPNGVTITSPPVHIIDANMDLLEIEKEVKRISPLILKNSGSFMCDKVAHRLS